MWNKIKQIISDKEKNIYSAGNVNPIEFHSVVHFLTKSYGLYDESVFAWSNMLVVFMIMCPLPGIAISILAFYHGCLIRDAAVIIETGTYIIILSYKICILSCFKLNIKDFHALTRILRADFIYVCTDGNSYRERFFQNQLQTWKICMLIVGAMTSLTLGMVVAALLTLIYYLITHDSESDGQRPLLFPFWAFDIDFNKSPYYELAFSYSELAVMAYGYNYVVMIATQILWIREIATKADLVIWKIQDLMNDIHPATNKREAIMFSNIIKHRMRAIIYQHQSMYELMEHYSRVHKRVLMYEQTFCGPVVCLTAYSAAEKLEDGEVNSIVIILCFCTVVVALVPSYLCTFLRIKVSSVMIACTDVPFWNTGPILRPYLVLMMQRSLRPLPLSFGGFQEVSLQTFASKMSSAYSCFNMLRQAFK